MVGLMGLVACSGNNTFWGRNTESVYDEGTVPFFDENPVATVDSQLYMNNPTESAKIYNKRVPPLNSLLVCRSKQCAPAEMSMSREYIFNSIAHLIDNNLDTKALLCEANPQAHVCTNPYLTVPAKIGMTPAYVFFDGVKIVDASIAKGKTAVNLALAYDINYNGQTPTVCKPDVAMAYVKSNNEVILNGNGFKCDMTSIGTTIVKVMFDIDYIDLDYGYIGGYYSIGLSGPANGGGSGYGLIRLIKDAHPLNPQLMKHETPKPQPVVKPQINESAVNRPLKEEKSTIKDEIKSVEENDAVENTKADENRGNISENKADTKVETKKEIKFEEKNSRQFENPKVNVNQPIMITPDTIVKSDKVVLKPKSQDIRPVEVKSMSAEPIFEEIEVDDLDDYIK